MHQSVFVIGTGSGTGKTTLTSALHEQLHRQNVPCNVVYETEVTAFPEFAEFYTSFQAGEASMAEPLKRAVEVMLRTRLIRDRINITESLLPFVRWLVLGGLSDRAIGEYLAWLDERLHGAAPVLVVLQCDEATGHRRARMDRGDRWHRAHGEKSRQYPIFQVEPDLSYVRVYERIERLLQRVGWTRVNVDTSCHSLDVCVSEVLERLGFPEAGRPDDLADATAVQYVGRYQLEHPNVSEHWPMLIEVQRRANGLTLDFGGVDVALLEREKSFRLAGANAYLSLQADALEEAVKTILLESKRLGFARYVSATGG